MLLDLIFEAEDFVIWGWSAQASGKCQGELGTFFGPGSDESQ